MSNPAVRPAEALLLTGFSYDEAAAICESAVETIKSRVNRARTRLSKLLSIDSPTDSAQIKRRVPF
jgi:RNA polymerase sigma-70 factor (ECF subfamily)